jgi:putative exporter of polyketide antibiotics
MKLGKWFKDNGLFIALIAALFVAAIIENGVESGILIAAGVCYVLAVLRFCAAAIPALILRDRLSRADWSCLGFAIGFVLVAHALGFPDMVELGLFGVVCGSILGLYFLFVSTRSRID